MVFPSEFGGGGSRENSKEKSLLYLYGWLGGWKEKRIVTIATIY